MTVLVAADVSSDVRTIRPDEKEINRFGVSCVDMELNMSGDLSWVGLVERFISDQFTTHSCRELTIRDLN